jgi:DNA modification methylase
MSDQIETVQLDDLTPWEDNPRFISPADLARLMNQIKRLGQYKPLIVDDNNVILGGNMRYRALRQMGIKEVWVSRVHPKTETERVEYALSDNDRAGQTDEEALAQLLMSVPDINLDDFKVDLGELTSLGSLLDKYAPTPEEDEIPEVGDGPARVQRGEIYELGNHRLMCGDATIEADIKALMVDNKARMVFTDPPYNIDYQGGGGAKRAGIMNDNMPQKQFYKFLHKALANMMEYTTGAFYICMSQQELHTVRKAFDDAGGHWQDYIIWVKNTFTLGGSDFQHQYEPILYGWNEKGKRHVPDFRDESDVWMNLEQIKPKLTKEGNTLLKLGAYTLELEGKVKGKIKRKRDYANIWEVDKPSKNPDHPTQKPVRLVSKAIRYSSERQDIILDLFGGSGSTLIASDQTDRRCYTMELDPKYCDVIIKRWETISGMTAKKIK